MLGLVPSTHRAAHCVLPIEHNGAIEAAIQRETSLKRYCRQWKIKLIEHENPHWLDHYSALLALPGNRIA